MFERFNPEARAVIVRSQAQARELGHNYIGTEHVLLGLLVEPTGTVAGDVLREAGLRHEDVRQMILDLVGRGEGAGAGHIPFTPRSKKVLELSLREALKLRHKYIGPEHIVLGLVREGEGVAAQIMVKVGANLPDVRAAVLERSPALGRRGRGFGPARVVVPQSGLTPGAVRASDWAVKRAKGGPVGSQHYLLGLLDEEDGLAAKALGALGVTKDTIESKLAELGPEGTTDELPERAGARNTRVEVKGDEIHVRIVESDLAERLRNYGSDLPGNEQLWKSLRTALENMTVAFEKRSDPGWVPPGFGKAGVATFAVVSQAGGLSCQLWTANGIDPDQVRAWLAEWFQTKPITTPENCSYLSVAVGRLGDVVPEAREPDEFALVGFNCGPGGPKFGGQALPVAELVAAAVANLSRGSGPSAPR